MACTDDSECFVPLVDTRNLHLMTHRSRRLLVGQKIVLQPINQRNWTVSDILKIAIGCVVLHHGNDLVIRFPAVSQAESADRDGGEENIAVRDGFFSEHTNIEWIAIAHHVLPLGPLGKEPCHSVAAERLRNKPVVHGAIVREPLRAIHFQKPTVFIDLVLHGVRRYDFDIRRHDLGCLLANRNPVPGMRLEHQTHQSLYWIAHCPPHQIIPPACSKISDLKFKISKINSPACPFTSPPERLSTISTSTEMPLGFANLAERARYLRGFAWKES